jgi:hypothetical protein
MQNSLAGRDCSHGQDLVAAEQLLHRVILGNEELEFMIHLIINLILVQPPAPRAVAASTPVHVVELHTSSPDI